MQFSVKKPDNETDYRGRVSVDIWTDGCPVWIHLYVNGESETLSSYECKCLIAALEEVIKIRDKED